MGFTNIENVFKEWDDSEELRDRLREGGPVLPTPAGQDITTCIKNSILLTPLLARMSSDSKRTVPSIDQLKEEIEALLRKKQTWGRYGGCRRAEEWLGPAEVVRVHQNESPTP